MELYLQDNCRIVSAIFANLSFFVSSYLLGRILFSGFNFRRKTTEILVFTLSGFDLLGFFALVLGNSFDGRLYFLTVLLLFFLMITDVRFRRIVFSLPFSLYNFFSVFSVRRIVFFIPLIAVSIFISGRIFSPPSSWDELVYQLAVPVRWIEAGGSEVFPDNPYSGFPSFSGIVFRVLLFNGGLLAPRLAVFILFVISVFAFVRIISPLCSRMGVFALSSAFVFSFPVLMVSSSAYSEIFILANFAVVLLLVQERDWIMRNNLPLLPGLAAGILVGAAASVKLTGLIFLPVVFVLLFSAREQILRNIFSLLSYVFVVLLFVFIFYLRPYIFTGNPFYPYFAWFFSDENPVIEMSRYHHALAADKYGIGGIRSFFVTPFLLAVDIGGFDGAIGLQFVMILVFAVFSFIYLCRKDKFASICFKAFVLFLIFYVFWFFSSQQARFFVPGIFLLCIASAYFLSVLYKKKILFIFLIILTVVSIPAKFAKDCLISWKTVFGLVRKTDYLYSATGPGYLKLCDMIYSDAGSDKKYLLLFEHRGLYLKCNYRIGTPFFQVFFTPPEDVKVDTLREIFRREGITHLIVGLSYYDPDRLPYYLNRSAKIAELIGLLEERNYILRVWEEEGFAVFRINWEQFW